MKELQKDVAEPLYWLSTLIITVTALHSSTSLILRSLSKAGALSAEPLSAKRRDRAVKGLIARWKIFGRRGVCRRTIAPKLRKKRVKNRKETPDRKAVSESWRPKSRFEGE